MLLCCSAVFLGLGLLSCILGQGCRVVHQLGFVEVVQDGNLHHALVCRSHLRAEIALADHLSVIFESFITSFKVDT